MPAAADAPTILVVPGLRDHVAQHWQTLLAARLQARGDRFAASRRWAATT